MVNLSFNDTLAFEHYNLIKPIIEHRINTILTNKGFKRGKKKNIDVTLSSDLERFLSLLKNNFGLKTLLTCRPNRMRRFIKNTLISNSSFYDSSTDDYRILENIFIGHGYNNKQFCKKDFIDFINVSTCPYCNRNYIFTLAKNQIIKPEIDHFYPKTIYPFLGLSYYNLIPSCQTCNGVGGKHKDDTYKNKLVNPYEISNDHFTFSYKLKLEKKNPLLNSSVDIFFSKKIEINDETFKLEALYKKHDDHIIELIIKRKIKYSKRYIKYLMAYKGLNISNQEIDRMILGNYSQTDEIHKRPLAKLYQDIGKELGLI